MQSRRIRQRQIEQNDIRLAGSGSRDPLRQRRRPDHRILVANTSDAGQADIRLDQPRSPGSSSITRIEIRLRSFAPTHSSMVWQAI
jgi:hypothetical protein